MSRKSLGHSVPNFQEHLVTPSMARGFLAKNRPAGNRVVRARSVDDLAAAIIRGEWKLSHQAIAFDVEGNLIDGQHRLLAIVKANISVPMMLAFGVDPEAYDVLDIGVRRSNADILSEHPRVIEVCNLITEAMDPRQAHRPTPQQVEPYHAVFAGKAHALLDVTSRARRVLTATAMRAAAAIRMFEHHDYVLDIYKGFVSGDIESLPPLARAFVFPALSGTGRRFGRYDLFCRGWVLFDPAKKNLTKVVVHDRDSKLDEIREEIDRLMLRHNETEGARQASAVVREMATA